MAKRKSLREKTEPVALRDRRMLRRIMVRYMGP